MNAAARDTRLPLQARAIAFWIMDNPSEGIDPDIIAKANNLAASYVRKLLTKLAEFGHLIAPQKVRGKKGRFDYTPYMLPPQDKITSTVEEPARSETPHGENNQSGQETITGEKSSGLEYAHTHKDAAGDKDSLLSLNTKNSLVLSEPEKDKTDSLTPDNLNNGVTDDFEDEPVTEVDIAPLDTRDDGYGKAAVAFLQKISPLTEPLQNDLVDTVKDYGSYATVLAIYDAANEVAKAQRGERTPIKCTTWSYAKGILKKQKSEGDLPVEVAFKSDTPSDEFDPFDRDDDLPESEIEPEPVNAQWQELNDFIQSQNRELYRMHLSQCRFGTFEAGKLSVLVPTERIQTGCIWELNHRGVFTKWCQDFWQGLETVEFILEEVQIAHPETG